MIFNKKQTKQPPAIRIGRRVTANTNCSQVPPNPLNPDTEDTLDYQLSGVDCTSQTNENFVESWSFGTINPNAISNWNDVTTASSVLKGTTPISGEFTSAITRAKIMAAATAPAGATAQVWAPSD